MSVSKDLLTWEEKWPIFFPKIGAPVEKGETQFYAMSGVIARGDLLIGLVKMLRDDLNATAGKTAKEMGDMDRKGAGIGYTVLAWSRDGRTPGPRSVLTERSASRCMGSCARLGR